MRIKSVKKIGKLPVYDISVSDAEHYILENGVVTHNTGFYLSSDNIWIIGRRQDQDKDKELQGYHFIINIEKSRHVKEKSKIPITVGFEGGINKWSGLFEIAKDGGFIKDHKKGTYTIDGEKSFREKDTNTKEFWTPFLTDPKFNQYIKDSFRISNVKMIQEDEVEN